MKTFDLKKPVQTRDGFKARVICADAVGTQPLIALVTDETGTERMQRYDLDGSWCDEEGHHCDLVNIPERHVRWVNVYDGFGGGSNHPSKEIADALANVSEGHGPERIACIRVEFCEGDGL